MTPMPAQADISPPNAAALYSVSTLVNSATTTKLITHSNLTTTYVSEVMYVNSAATAGNKYEFEYGTQTTNPCDTGTVLLIPVGISFGSNTANVSGQLLGGSSGGGAASVTVGSVFYSVPPNNDFCVVTSGATNSEYFMTWYYQW